MINRAAAPSANPPRPHSKSGLSMRNISRSAVLAERRRGRAGRLKAKARCRLVSALLLWLPRLRVGGVRHRSRTRNCTSEKNSGEEGAAGHVMVLEIASPLPAGEGNWERRRVHRRGSR